MIAAGMSAGDCRHRCNQFVFCRTASRAGQGLDTLCGTQKMGFCPLLLAGLPVIDRSANVPQVPYACGHGHLGLTPFVCTRF